MSKEIEQNPLGTVSIGKLIYKFAIPSIIAMLVGAIYNIVDQLFIGRYVGEAGNAATSVAFPLTISCTALALLFGIGGASSFNIAMGQKQKDKAAYYIGNSITMLVCCGLVLFLITQVFLKQLLLFFGAPEDVLEYAMVYVRITSFGFPFLILTTGGGHIIRADGSPKMTMICSLSGAIINTVLDAVFVPILGMGMFGAALATIIGQIFSGILVVLYLLHYRTVTLSFKHLRIQKDYIGRIISLGMASFFNQISLMIVQIVLNKSLTVYGAKSVYGASVALACSGIVMKVSQIFFAIVIGIAQGTQPIESFNYGAKNYRRVKDAYLIAIKFGAIVSVVFLIIFQCFPRPILALFGTEKEVAFQFGISYFRIFLFFTWLNFLQPITSTFFTSIGKAYKGIFLSLTRQIIFLLPLMIILPLFMGISGILYSAPIADFIAAFVAIFMVVREFKLMDKEV